MNSTKPHSCSAVQLCQCPQAHSHSLPWVPGPAHRHPCTSCILGDTHPNRLHFFHLQGPDLDFSCWKHDTAPSYKLFSKQLLLNLYWEASRGKASLRPPCHLATAKSHPMDASPSAWSRDSASPCCQPASSVGTGEQLSLPTPVRHSSRRRCCPQHRAGSGSAGSITHGDTPAARAGWTRCHWECHCTARSTELPRETNENRCMSKYISCLRIIPKSQWDILQIRVENEHFMNDKLYFFHVPGAFF